MTDLVTLNKRIIQKDIMWKSLQSEIYTVTINVAVVRELVGAKNADATLSAVLGLLKKSGIRAKSSENDRHTFEFEGFEQVKRFSSEMNKILAHDLDDCQDTAKYRVLMEGEERDPQADFNVYIHLILQKICNELYKNLVDQVAPKF